MRISSQILKSEDMDKLLKEILSKEEINYFETNRDLDTSVSLEGLSRIRINAYFSSDKKCLTLRILPGTVPNWNEIGLPKEFINLSKLHKGLILCTGPTGSGKSTSLASFLNHILETQNKHIITIEDPIEYQFNHTKKSIIHQREVKSDTLSFASALRASSFFSIKNGSMYSDVVITLEASNTPLRS